MKKRRFNVAYYLVTSLIVLGMIPLNNLYPVSDKNIIANKEAEQLLQQSDLASSISHNEPYKSISGQIPDRQFQISAPLVIRYNSPFEQTIEYDKQEGGGGSSHPGNSSQVEIPQDTKPINREKFEVRGGFGMSSSKELLEESSSPTPQMPNTSHEILAIHGARSYLTLTNDQINNIGSSTIDETTAIDQEMKELPIPTKVVVLAGYTDTPPPSVPPPETFKQRVADAPQIANINITYIGNWDPQAQNAVQYAADIWETLINSSVTIEVEANWTPLGAGVLGGAYPSTSLTGFLNQPVSNTWYPIALANMLSGFDLRPATPDINAEFNSTRTDWYFGIDGNTPANQYDFVSVVLHELGHGLGFTGSMTIDETICGGPGLGCWGNGDPNGYPFIFDRFAENGNNQSLLSFPNNSAELGAQLVSDDIYFDGSSANEANSNCGEPPKLYTPTTWEQGSSYAHLDETTFPSGNLNALMTPFLSNGEAIHDPGLITLGMFTDMDYSVDWPGGIVHIDARNLVVGDLGVVNVEVIAPRCGEFKVRVWDDDGFTAPEWDWEWIESGVISLSAGEQQTFSFYTTPDTTSEGFEFWLYRKDFLGLFKIVQKIEHTLTAAPADTTPPHSHES